MRIWNAAGCGAITRASLAAGEAAAAEVEGVPTTTEFYLAP
jgi:hypothetical protein